MFTCIMCLGQFPDDQRSEEHIFPDSLGGTLTMWDLCVPCNSHLGSKVDSHLINNWFMNGIRQEFKLAGKTGKIPHFLEGLDLIDEDGHTLQVRSAGGQWRLHTVPSVIPVSDTADGAELHIVVDATEESKIEGMLKKIIDRRRAQGKPSRLVGQERRKVTIQRPKVKATFSIDGFSWQRGLLKIAYELTYRLLGEQYLQDPLAAVYRDILTQDEVTPDYLTGRITGRLGHKNQIQLSFPLSQLGKSERLTAAVIQTNSRLMVYVNIFNIFTALVCTTEQPNQYPLQKAGQVYVIDVRNGDVTECSLEHWIANLPALP